MSFKTKAGGGAVCEVWITLLKAQTVTEPPDRFHGKIAFLQH